MIDRMITEIKPTRKNIRNFGITIGLFLMIFGGILFWKEIEDYIFVTFVGIVFIVCGLGLPIILKPIYLFWMIVSSILGWVMTRVVLSILFFTMITAIGLISKLFGKQFLDLKWDNSKNSYWDQRQGKPEKSSYENQF